uniref:Uncharacterized protein n=1 Tax=Trichogramma kaykai TaxID=54128 RepID=A0ABD2XCX3_9HYME
MELFNQIASPLMIVILTLVSMCLVISAFWMVILSKTDVAEAFRMFCAFSLATISLFFICLPSQVVVDTNTYVYNSCYSCNWYDYPTKSRKYFQLFILRLSKTLVVPAGPLAKLNFETYGNIIKTSLSYTTALMTIYL